VLFTIAQDLTSMELRVQVDEADVAQVREGQDATFTVDAHPGRTFNAKVTRVRSASATTDGVVTYEAVLQVDNEDLSLRPGMTATADLTVQGVKNALLIPNAALRFTPPAEGGQQAGAQRSGAAGAQQGGGLVGQLIPRPRFGGRRQGAGAGTNARGAAARDAKVYTLQAGKPVALDVRVGATDGRNTQVLRGDVQQGTPLVVDTAAAKGD
jgi:HlyD family secretion protein